MNERIRELVEQCYEKHQLLGTYEFNKEKFAESIIQDCLNMCDWQTGQRIQKHFEYRDNRWPETELNPRPF